MATPHVANVTGLSHRDEHGIDAMDADHTQNLSPSLHFPSHLCALEPEKRPRYVRQLGHESG